MGFAYVRFVVSHPAHDRVLFGHELQDRDGFPALYGEGVLGFGRLLDGSAALLSTGATEQ